MGKLNNKFIRAGTLIEVLVALVVLMISISTSSVIFLNVITGRGSSHEKIEIELLLSSQSIFINQNESAGQVAKGKYHVERKIQAYNGNDALQLVTINIYGTDGKLLGSRKQIIKAGVIDE